MKNAMAINTDDAISN